MPYKKVKNYITKTAKKRVSEITSKKNLNPRQKAEQAMNVVSGIGGMAGATRGAIRKGILQLRSGRASRMAKPEKITEAKRLMYEELARTQARRRVQLEKRLKGI